MTRIYISRETICANQRTGRNDPVIRVEAEGLPPAYTNRAVVNGPCVVVYANPQDNGNGVSAWVETEADVSLTPEE
jgi:hypothetical protein